MCRKMPCPEDMLTHVVINWKLVVSTCEFIWTTILALIVFTGAFIAVYVYTFYSRGQTGQDQQKRAKNESESKNLLK